MAVDRVADKPLAELISVRGRVAVVTGAGAGIGRSTALRLAEAGARVLVTDIDLAAAQDTVARLAGDGHLAHALDVTDADAVAVAADRAMSELGGLDIWVNLAGIYPMSPALDLSADEWRRVLAINLDGTFFGAREAARHMAGRDAGYGVVINCVSTVVYKVSASGLAAYIASKGGIEALTRALAFEFGPQKVRVLAVAPTITRTEGVMAQKAALEAAIGTGDDPHELYERRLPLGRMCDGDDVARAILFMVSDMAIMMTGSVLYVDGGDAIF